MIIISNIVTLGNTISSGEIVFYDSVSVPDISQTFSYTDGRTIDPSATFKINVPIYSRVRGMATFKLSIANTMSGTQAGSIVIDIKDAEDKILNTSNSISPGFSGVISLDVILSNEMYICIRNLSAQYNASYILNSLEIQYSLTPVDSNPTAFYTNIVWPPKLILYNSGNENASFTGGYFLSYPKYRIITAGVGNKLSDALQISNEPSGFAYCGYCTANPIDLTGYSKIKIAGSYSGNNRGYAMDIPLWILNEPYFPNSESLYSSNIDKSVNSILPVYDASSNPKNFEKELNILNINGQHQLAFGISVLALGNQLLTVNFNYIELS